MWCAIIKIQKNLISPVGVGAFDDPQSPINKIRRRSPHEHTKTRLLFFSFISVPTETNQRAAVREGDPPFRKHPPLAAKRSQRVSRFTRREKTRRNGQARRGWAPLIASTDAVCNHQNVRKLEFISVGVVAFQGHKNTHGNLVRG